MTLTDEQKRQCQEAFHNTREMPLGSMLRNSKPHPEFVAGYVAGLSAQPESKPATLTEDRELAQRFMQEADEGEDSIEELLKQCVSFCRAYFQQQVGPATQPGMVMVPEELLAAFVTDDGPDQNDLNRLRALLAAAPRDGR